MKKCYFAAPFFSKAEQDFNSAIAEKIRAIGYEVLLPQEFPENKGEEFVPDFIFKNDIEKVNQADFLIAVLEGTDPDSGTCFEVGYAYAQSKKIYGLRTDIRNENRNFVNLNLMLSQSCDKVFTEIEDLIKELTKV